jgi:hypothetical protein
MATTEDDPPGERNASNITPIKSISAISSGCEFELNDGIRESIPLFDDPSISDHRVTPRSFTSIAVPARKTLPPPFSIKARKSVKHPQSTPVEKSIIAVSFVGRGQEEIFLQTAVARALSSMLDVFLERAVDRSSATSFCKTSKYSDVESDVTWMVSMARISQGSEWSARIGVMRIKSCVLFRTLEEAPTEGLCRTVSCPPSHNRSVMRNFSAVPFGRDTKL